MFPLEMIVPLVATLPFTQKFPELIVIAPSALEAANIVYGYDSAPSAACAETIGIALTAIVALSTQERNRLKIGFIFALLNNITLESIYEIVCESSANFIVPIG